MTAICVAAAVLLALAPTRTYAGDKEWATAGKILTGVVAAQVLLGVMPVVVRPRAAVIEHRVTRYEPPCRPQPRQRARFRCPPQPRQRARFRYPPQRRGYTIRIEAHESHGPQYRNDRSAHGRTEKRRVQPAGHARVRDGTRFSIW